jgi:hypothetical protein
MMLAGLGVAAAQTDSSTTTAPEASQPQPPPPAAAAAPAPGDPKGPRGRFGERGMGKFGFGGIHGEMTTRAPGGGYQTLATQQGEVTSVSATSVTVKSEDGFSRTYGVDDGTLVNAGNEGIADVKTGDQVHVIALVKDGKATAVSLRDGTQVKQSRERWAPPRKA